MKLFRTLPAFLFLIACNPGPFPPPPQYVMPPGEDPLLPPPDPDRLLVAMSEQDVDRFLVDGFKPGREGEEYRFTGAHPKLRFPRVPASRRLDFVLRAFVNDDLLKPRGSVVLSVFFNERRFTQITVKRDGVMEYRQPVPREFLETSGPVDIRVDVDPLFNGGWGIQMHTIGFVEPTR